MTNPKCEKCGNEGDKAGLYLTIDAAWNPATKAWTLEEREDIGGMGVDCLACDHSTEVGSDIFPYGIEIPTCLFGVMIGYGAEPNGAMLPEIHASYDDAEREATSRRNGSGRWACVVQIAGTVGGN